MSGRKSGEQKRSGACRELEVAVYFVAVSGFTTEVLNQSVTAFEISTMK